MWESKNVLKAVIKKTGLSVEEIQNTCWGEIEMMLNLKGIFWRSRRNGYLFKFDKHKIISKDKFKQDEERVLSFLSKI